MFIEFIFEFAVSLLLGSKATGERNMPLRLAEKDFVAAGSAILPNVNATREPSPMLEMHTGLFETARRLKETRPRWQGKMAAAHATHYHY